MILWARHLHLHPWLTGISKSQKPDSQTHNSQTCLTIWRLRSMIPRLSDKPDSHSSDSTLPPTQWHPQLSDIRDLTKLGHVDTPDSMAPFTWWHPLLDGTPHLTTPLTRRQPWLDDTADLTHLARRHPYSKYRFSLCNTPPRNTCLSDSDILTRRHMTQWHL
jgi:hypothetical protein